MAASEGFSSPARAIAGPWRRTLRATHESLSGACDGGWRAVVRGWKHLAPGTRRRPAIQGLWPQRPTLLEILRRRCSLAARAALNAEALPLRLRSPRVSWPVA